MTNRAWRVATTVAGALTVAATVLAGCGRGGSDQPVAAGAAPAAVSGAAASTGPALPTLPPVQQRDPDLFDERGCPRTGPDTASCSSTAADVDRANATPGPDQRLAGFVGGSWSTAPPTGTVVVLGPSVTTTPTADGRWSALGLVRNQRVDGVGSATVRAELVAGDGSVLESVRGDAMVHPLRSGEPAPFRLVATTSMASKVASVRWSADAPVATAASAGDSAARNIELQTYWTRRPAENRRIDNYLFHDPATGPAPLVVFGSATNLAPAPINAPRVVAAWLDAGGRVVLVRDAPLSASTGDAAPSVASSGADDFLFAVPFAELPAGIDLAAPMLWGFGS